MSFWSKNIPIPNEIKSNVFPGIYLKISYHQSRQWFGAARQQGKFYLKKWWVITDKESIRNMTSVGQKKLRPQPHEIEEYILKYYTGKARKSVVNYRAVIQSLIGIAVKAKLKNADTHFILLTSYKHSPSDHPKNMIASCRWTWGYWCSSNNFVEVHTKCTRMHGNASIIICKIKMCVVSQLQNRKSLWQCRENIMLTISADTIIKKHG